MRDSGYGNEFGGTRTKEVGRLETFDRDDEQLRHDMSALDERLKDRLLETWLTELPLDTRTTVDKRRVKERVFRTLELPLRKHHRTSRARVWLWAATVVMAAVGVGVVVPNPVSAAIGRVFRFVPGIGTVEQTHEGSPLVILPKSVQSSWHGASVHVMGVMISSHAVMIELSGHSPHAPTQVTLVASGRKIHAQRGAAARGSGPWIATYGARGGFGSLLHNQTGTLKIGASQLGIPVKLRLAPSAREMARFGPTQTHHGISLTAIAARNGTDVTLNVVAEHRGRLSMLSAVPWLPSGNGPNIQIVDHQGNELAAKQVFRFSFGPNAELNFPAVSGVTTYQVTIPEVEVEYSGQTHVILPLPASGSQQVNRHVNVAGVPLDITTVRRMPNGSQTLRIYVKPARSSTIVLNAVDINSPDGYGWRVNSQTGALEWIDITVKPGQRSVNLRFSDPTAYVRGPWSFQIHVPSN